MDYKKYEDMAYGNPRGKKWLEILHSPEIWPRWVKEVEGHADKRLLKLMSAEEHATRIITEAVWYLGFVQRLNDRELKRCALRLRRPPDRGDGVDEERITPRIWSGWLNRIPWEFIWLDDFLEYWVRPLVQ